jgi:hypothetical protein
MAMMQCGESSDPHENKAEVDHQIVQGAAAR